MAPALACALRAAPGRSRISRYEIATVKIPFAERVREAWISSWKNQKRDQNDFVVHFVKLSTGDGLVGIGEAKMEAAKARAILDGMVGRSPWDYVLDDSIRSILIAVYDLLGKAAGKPVARLFSEQPKRSIIPTWWSQCFPPPVMAAEAKLAVERGYKVHKVKARPWEDAVEQAAAMCAVVPKDFKIWVDANSTWATVERTLDLTRKLAGFSNYLAVESPIARANVEGYRQLKGKMALPVAEHVDGIDVNQWTREGLLDAWISGAPKLGAYLKGLAESAQSERKPIWIEHSIDNGIAQVFQAHQAAAWPSLQYSISVTHVLEDDCMREPFLVRNGEYTLPSKPGLGVSLDEAAIDKYRIA